MNLKRVFLTIGAHWTQAPFHATRSAEKALVPDPSGVRDLGLIVNEMCLAEVETGKELTSVDVLVQKRRDPATAGDTKASLI